MKEHIMVLNGLYERPHTARSTPLDSAMFTLQ